MQRKLLFVFLLGILLLVSLSALEPHELSGTWSWGEPIYSEGVMGVDGYTDYTLYITSPAADGSMFYALYDENDNVVHQGHLLVQKGLLNFYYNPTNTKEVYQYSFGEGFMGSLELCEYHDYPSQNAYFSISRMDFTPSKAAKTLNNGESYETALSFAWEGVIQESDQEESLNSLFQYAFALGGLGRHEDAINFWYEYLEYKPDDSQALFNMEWNREKMAK